MALDKFRETVITWDTANRKVYQPLRVSGSDERGRKLVVQVVNDGVIEDLTGVSLALAWRTRKNVTGLDPFTANNPKEGIFELFYTNRMLQNVGVLKGNLVLVDTTGRIVSDDFNVTVFDKIDDSAAGSQAELSLLQQALSEFSSYDSKIASKADKAMTEQSILSLNQKLSETEKTLQGIDKAVGEKTYSNLNELKADTLADKKKRHVVASDGFWYWWNGTEWTKGTVFQATGLDSTLRDVVHEYINSPIKNMIKNGNFMRGSENWDLINATLVRATGGEIVVDTKGEHNRIQQEIPANVGDVIYRAAYVKSDAKDVGVGSLYTLFKSHSGSGNYEYLSDTRVAESVNYLSIIDKRKTGNNGFSVMNALTINLTASFGKGNEPTNEEMNLFLSAYPFKWFDNTATKLDGLVKQIRSDVDNSLNLLNVPTRNLFKNSNFESTDGWGSVFGSVSATNNVLSLVSNGANKAARMTSNLDISYASGKKLFLKATVRVDNDMCSNVYLGVNGATGGVVAAKRIDNPLANEWFDIYGVCTLTTGATGNVYLNLLQDYANAEIANGKKLDVKKIVGIDLTETFGSGNEPDEENINELLLKYPGGWFERDLISLLTTKEIYIQKNELKAELKQFEEYQLSRSGLNDFIKSVAHRGYSDVAPENTLPAYELAEEKGFSYVETDVAWTADNVPVLLHDDAIDRTSNGTGLVSSLTFNQLRTYDFGSWKNSAYAGTKIPSFKEFIIFCKRKNLHPYIELKTPTTADQSNQLNQIVKTLGMAKHVTWISFITENLVKMLNADPTARIGINYDSRFDQNSIDLALTLKTSENEVFLNIMYQAVTTELAESSLMSDIPIEVWTVNDTNVIDSLVEKGVSGIATDRLNLKEML